MKLLFDIAHPGHVHLFKYPILHLKKKGHSIDITVKNIHSAISLLKAYELPFQNLGKKRDSLVGKGLSQLGYDFKILKLAKKNKYDLGISSNITIPHVSMLTGMKAIVMDDDDDEAVSLFVKTGHPFTDAILSPSVIKRKSKKNLSYDGTHELAYLHPNHFTPDQGILKELGVKKDDRFFILRFNSFKAYHDVGIAGISYEDKLKVVDYLKDKGKILITTEREIDPELKKYQIVISPEKIHSVLNFATMFIGDSQTMTSEAAVLGTPALKCNTFAGRLSVPNELEHKYGLCYAYQPADFPKMLAKIDELLAMPDLKEEWQHRRQKMLSEKIDVTAFFVWFIENYPDSARIMKKDPDYQWRFR